jgi:pimeloyl-ACP methyl ester carboxylesterase
MATKLTQGSMAKITFCEFFTGTSTDNMYVQKWESETSGNNRRIVMVHGGAHSGVFWTMSAEGKGPGWAQYFAENGWTVYVIDWAGVGRSGRAADYLTMTHDRVEDPIINLLGEVGPSVLMGHSMGGGFSIKVASRRPDLVSALVALASAPIANSKTDLPNVQEQPLDWPIRITIDDAKLRFTNGSRFPHAAFAHYYRSLVPYSPNIRNAAVRANDGFWLADVGWTQRMPILFLAAEHDQSTVTGPSARFLGVKETLLGRDWNLPGYAHSFPIEEGNKAIADRIIEWLAQNVRNI